MPMYYALSVRGVRLFCSLACGLLAIGIHVAESPDLQTVNTILVPRSLVNLYMIRQHQIAYASVYCCMYIHAYYSRSDL